MLDDMFSLPKFLATIHVALITTQVGSFLAWPGGMIPLGVNDAAIAGVGR